MSKTGNRPRKFGGHSQHPACPGPPRAVIAKLPCDNAGGRFCVLPPGPARLARSDRSLGCGLWLREVSDLPIITQQVLTPVLTRLPLRTQDSKRIRQGPALTEHGEEAKDTRKLRRQAKGGLSRQGPLREQERTALLAGWGRAHRVRTTSVWERERYPS